MKQQQNDKRPLSMCSICHSSNSEKLFMAANTHGRHVINQAEHFQLYRCSECSNIFIGNIAVNKEYYKKYYGPGYYESTISPRGLPGRVLEALAQRSFRIKERMITRYCGNKKSGGTISILDIGCGSGNFLQRFDPEKYERHGIEINREGYDLCYSKGLEVYNDNLLKIDFGERRFNAVTLWHVFEHLEKPLDYFQKIREILEKDGVFIFAVPNSDSLGFKLGRENWFHLDSPRHLFIPNMASIKHLCNKTGFSIVAAKNEFYDYPLDLFWSIRKNSLKYLVYPFYPLVKMFSKETLTFVCKTVQM